MQIKKYLITLSSLILLLCTSVISQEGDRDTKVAEIVKAATPQWIDIRRDLHAHPELSFQEKRTAEVVAKYFENLGLEVKTGIGGPGVLGILRGGKPGPVVGIRGDMDGLPITEATGLAFASQAKTSYEGREVGVMHACGHDIHTTVLLGTAYVLAQLRSELPGTVMFIAQPAEEWGDGANEMVKAGVLKDIKPEAMFAFHVADNVQAGYLNYIPGDACANCDGIHLIIKSTGGHGAHPAVCVDPIVVGAQIVIALQVLVAREIDVHNNTVITVGSFHAGSARNIIPPKAELKAIIRTYGEDQRKLLRGKVERLVTNICEAAGAQFELNYDFGTPSLYNDPKLLQKILPTLERVLGEKKFIQEELPSMGGEDFSYFAREVPSVMLGLGVTPKNMEKNALHTPAFIADEECIPVGTRSMASIVLDYLYKSADAKR